MVGAFVEGAPIYLRENVDYHLHSYAADDGKYRFAKQDSLVGGKGYLLKVPSDVSDFDNHTLYIYSDKGTSVNGEKAENGQALFEHTGNPRTHDISSKESITKTGILYQFDGEAFYRYKEGSVIAPFESVVCYNGEADKAPQRIDLIPDGLPHTHAAYTISLLDGRLRITGYQGEVGIYDTAGMLLRTATSDGTIEIQLPRKNLYLIDLGGKELLKVRPQ